MLRLSSKGQFGGYRFIRRPGDKLQLTVKRRVVCGENYYGSQINVEAMLDDTEICEKCLEAVKGKGIVEEYPRRGKQTA